MKIALVMAAILALSLISPALAKDKDKDKKKDPISPDLIDGIEPVHPDNVADPQPQTLRSHLFQLLYNLGFNFIKPEANPRKRLSTTVKPVIDKKKAQNPRVRIKTKMQALSTKTKETNPRKRIKQQLQTMSFKTTKTQNPRTAIKNKIKTIKPKKTVSKDVRKRIRNEMDAIEVKRSEENQFDPYGVEGGPPLSDPGLGGPPISG